MVSQEKLIEGMLVALACGLGLGLILGCEFGEWLHKPEK